MTTSEDQEDQTVPERDDQGMSITDHLIIRDVDTKEVVANQRGTATKTGIQE